MRGAIADDLEFDMRFFHPTGLEDVITEHALGLATLKDDIMHPSGTAIVIAPRLAMTARHVLEDYHQRIHEYPLTGGDHEVSQEIVAFLIRNKDNSIALWKVVKEWFSHVTDIALIQLGPVSRSAGDHHWRCPSLDLTPPRVGSQIVAFGYHSPEKCSLKRMFLPASSIEA